MSSAPDTVIAAHRTARTPRPAWRSPGASAWLPGCCAGCGLWPAHGLCGGCAAAFLDGLGQRRCARCAVPLAAGGRAHICGRCLTAPPAGCDAVVAAVDYVAPWDTLVTRLKFHGALDLAPVMARMLALAVRQAATLAPAPQCAVPVAMARARIAERGYNQAWQIARHLARELQLPALARALAREREVASQTRRTRAERLAALRGAFGAGSDAGQVRGRHVALVDDVMTTGATLQAAAAVLRAAGAASVTAWVFARTPDNRGQGLP